jgi:predicted ATPase
MEHTLERALAYAERGDQRDLSWVLGTMCRVALVGPRPVEAAIARCRTIRERAEGDLPVQAVSDAMLGVLEAMRGRFGDARRLYQRSETTLEDLGLKVQLASFQMYAGAAELIAGDAAAAERVLRAGYQALDRMGERSYLSTMAAFLARAVYAQERFDEAARLTAASDEAASADDLVSQVMWRGTQAKILARGGEGAAALELARQAATLSRETDFINMQADALADLAHVSILLDQAADAADVLEEAATLYEAKGNAVSAARARAQLEEVVAARPA